MKDEDRSFGVVLGGIAPVLLAMLLVPVRDDVSSVNIALLLVVPVVGAAALGGRLAGIAAGVMSAVSFNFFHTRPYLSLRIDSSDDVQTALILLGVGVIVGTVGSSERRAKRSAEEGRDELASVHRVAGLAAMGVEGDQVIEAARTELTQLLSLRACVFETPPFSRELPALQRHGSIGGNPTSYIATRRGFALPAGGVVLDVIGRGHVVGRFVLEPTQGTGTPRQARLAAVVIADQVGQVLAVAPL